MKAFTIILEGHELGESIGQEAIAAGRTHGVDVEIHNAVVGYNSRPKFEAYGIDKFLNYTIIDKPGHQGCFLSHYELWLKCAELDEPIIILEHDGIFVRPLPADVLDHFDEVLRLDCFHWNDEIYNQQVQDSLATPIDYWRKPYEYEYYCTGGYYIGAYGYIVKPAGARKLIAFSKERGVVCTEAMLGSKIVDLVSTTATVVRMHEQYIAQGVTYSTTNELGLMTSGSNSMRNATYISPRKYKQQYE